MTSKPLKFDKPALMKWDGNSITDHNRGDLSIDPERIESSNRMINGTRRSYVIADKRTFSCSWENVPHSAPHAVDGFWAGREIENWYNTRTQPFTLSITNGDGVVDTFLVVMTEFTKEITKRGNYDMWQVSVTMEEC